MQTNSDPLIILSGVRPRLTACLVHIMEAEYQEVCTHQLTCSRWWLDGEMWLIKFEPGDLPASITLTLLQQPHSQRILAEHLGKPGKPVRLTSNGSDLSIRFPLLADELTAITQLYGLPSTREQPTVPLFTQEVPA